MKKIFFAAKLMLSLCLVLAALRSMSGFTMLPRNTLGAAVDDGKPTLAVALTFEKQMISVKVHETCDSFRIRLRGDDGLRLDMTQTDFQFLCSENADIQIDTDAPIFGTGYLVVEIEIHARDGVQSMTRSFAFDSLTRIALKPQPTSVDQSGVRYHEFVSTR